MANPYSYGMAEKIARVLLERCGGNVPKIGLICGTGLSGIAEVLIEPVFVNYSDIPDFPVSTVHGHVGRFVFGKLGGKDCLCMQGRFHMYEGYDLHQVTLPVRVMKIIGIEILIVTNAAGGLNSDYSVGDIMIIKDHIFMPGMGGMNPLRGPNDERFGTRFPAISGVYSMELCDIAKRAAEVTNIKHIVREGVYVMVGGPSFETIAECRMLKLLGADVVGMSTCPEVIVAAHCGMKVFGMSMVTNKCVMEYEEDRYANHAEVLEAGAKRSPDIQAFVKAIIGLIPENVTCK